MPHEVIGMANYNKNILVGTGAARASTAAIIWARFTGWSASWAALRIRCATFSIMRPTIFCRHLPIVYVLTVVGRMRGRTGWRCAVFLSATTSSAFTAPSELSLKVNFEMLDAPIQKAVVYLDPHEFHSTWLGNKAVYRTRMALADGAELIVLAPGVKQFRRRPGHRHIDPQVRLSWNARNARSGECKCGSRQAI